MQQVGVDSSGSAPELFNHFTLVINDAKSAEDFSAWKALRDLRSMKLRGFTIMFVAVTESVSSIIDMLVYSRGIDKPGAMEMSIGIAWNISFALLCAWIICIYCIAIPPDHNLLSRLQRNFMYVGAVLAFCALVGPRIIMLDLESHRQYGDVGSRATTLSCQFLVS